VTSSFVRRGRVSLPLGGGPRMNSTLTSAYRNSCEPTLRTPVGSYHSMALRYMLTLMHIRDISHRSMLASLPVQQLQFYGYIWITYRGTVLFHIPFVPIEGLRPT